LLTPYDKIARKNIKKTKKSIKIPKILQKHHKKKSALQFFAISSHRQFSFVSRFINKTF